MSLTNYPNGVTSFGVPLMGGSVGIPATTGTYFFVHSTTGNSGNTGKGPGQAVTTIDIAVGLCTANKGDVIIVMPGHNETIVSATSLVVDVAGISIIGLGVNQSRPVLDFDNNSGSIEMDAANCRLSNIVLRASVTAVAVGINVDANDVTLDNLETTWEATGDDFAIIVDVDGFDRCTITDCKFFGELAVAGGVTSIRIDDSHNLVFQRNMMVGNSAIMFTMAGALSQTCVVTDNIMYNADTTDDSCWEIAVASTGILANNRTTTLNHAAGTGAAIDPGSMLCIENLVCNSIDESGELIPTTTSG